MSSRTDAIREAIVKTLASKMNEKITGLSVSPRSTETEIVGQFKSDSGLYNYTITQSGENFTLRVDPVSSGDDISV